MPLNTHRENSIKVLEDELIYHDEQEKLHEAKSHEHATLAKQHKEEKIKIQTILGNLKSAATPIQVGAKHVKSDLQAIEFPNYPHTGSLPAKFAYYEDMFHKVWRKSDMEQFIKRVEGKEADKHLKSFSSKLHYYNHSHQLINMRYNNSNRYSFYTTRLDWTTVGADGIRVLLPEYAPDADILKRLSEEQKDPKKIAWGGIKA